MPGDMGGMGGKGLDNRFFFWSDLYCVESFESHPNAKKFN